MFKHLKQDVPASLVVFLVALPLCLGIALASGAPLLSGMIAGIVGGIVVGIISQSHTSVSGPAAGLAAVVMSSIASLGGRYEVFLAAIVIAGGIQFIAGLAKGGIIANYIPSNVIKGLLASIGIILILKQIPHAVGFDKDPENDFSFFQSDGQNTFSELINMLDYFSCGTVMLSLVSIFILIVWDKTPLKKYQFLPVSLFVVVLGVAVNAMYAAFVPGLAISPDHLVTLPKYEGVQSLITFPDFSQIGTYKLWLVAVTLAVVASIETLLNLEAVENLDPKKRIASPNRELVAQGVGNMLSGLVGGLPITSVIVRGSVNIHAGAATKLSAILHALLLLLSLLVLGPIINLIPLASLACILIFTGYKLAKLSLFKSMYSKGLNQFIPFVVTILAIVFTDLLIGVLIGLVVSVFYILKSNYKNPFVIQKQTVNMNETVRLELPNQTSFLNKASIKDTLWSVPEGSKVIIDASYADFIDNDVLEIIEDYRNTISVNKKIKLNVIGLQKNYKLDDHIAFVNVLNKEQQQRLKPEEVLQLLKNGNERFLKGTKSEKYLKHQVNATAFGQNPFAIILSCIDSRTTTEHIFDLGLGDIFSVRIAGNILNEDILGSMEFAVKAVGVKLVVVLGHTSCGAIVGACNQVEMGNLTGLLNKVKPAIANETTISDDRTGNNKDFVNQVAMQNVVHTIARIRSESPIVAEFEQQGTIQIVGGMYDLETGAVSFYNS